MREIAIIGPTACGKSSLAIEVAKEANSYILSLDSLAIYKHIDIVSAKPTKEEMQEIEHFGISLINPDEEFNASLYLKLYSEVKEKCKKDKKNLIIVGGSSFYLKTIIDGLSDEPDYSKEAQEKTEKLLINIKEAYEFLNNIDPKVCKTIKPNDRYRIEKALLVYFCTGKNITDFREKNKKLTQKNRIKIFEIEIDREVLRGRIKERTKKMIQDGVIDEVAWLEKNYTRKPKSMNSIGIKETLEYFDGKINKKELADLISTHTAQFAKRQNTFNNNQFDEIVKKPKELLKKEIVDYLLG
ncbi:MAG: tRNA dimethylallyltransferase [Campylobacterota bacterium]|nr:tRNA dimethylallyltransferase [Campylobacterota bacterium]